MFLECFQPFLQSASGIPDPAKILMEKFPHSVYFMIVQAVHHPLHHPPGFIRFTQIILFRQSTLCGSRSLHRLTS